MAAEMIESFHVNLLSTTNLLIKTVMTARHMVVMAIHDTKFTTGPLWVSEMRGTRASNWCAAAAMAGIVTSWL
jgi:hypothetical protein